MADRVRVRVRMRVRCRGRTCEQSRSELERVAADSPDKHHLEVTLVESMGVCLDGLFGSADCEERDGDQRVVRRAVVQVHSAQMKK